MDLIPPEYVIARFFPEEKAELDALVVEQEAASQAVEEYIEEHAVEEGLLWEAVEDDKITKALATARLRVREARGCRGRRDPGAEARDQALRGRDRRQEGRQGRTAKLEELALAQYGEAHDRRHPGAGHRRQVGRHDPCSDRWQR